MIAFGMHRYSIGKNKASKNSTTWGSNPQPLVPKTNALPLRQPCPIVHLSECMECYLLGYIRTLRLEANHQNVPHRFRYHARPHEH